MTNEEIKKLSREYAEFTDGSPADKAYIRAIAQCFTEWLSKDYVIIPKSKVKEYYEDVCEDIRDYDGKGKFGLSCADMTMYQRARGMKQMLYRLFGKDTFEEEGK